MGKYIQARITKGTTLLANVPPSATYDSTKYSISFLCATGSHLETAGTADTATKGWTITVAHATTSGFATGNFAYELRVTDLTTGAVFLYDSGILSVVPSAASSEAAGAKTPAQKQLEAVQTAILECITTGATEYTIGDRSVKKLSLTELYALQRQLESRVKAEQTGRVGMRISLPNFLNTN